MTYLKYQTLCSMHPILFADDTPIKIKDSPEINLTNKCNEILNRLLHWTISNRLSINYDKTFYLIITNQNTTTQLDSITLNGHPLEKKTEGKFLGIILENKLKFSTHIKYICNKVSKTIGIIYRLKDLLPRQCLLYIFIYPYYL